MNLIKAIFTIAVILLSATLRGEIKIANIAVEFPNTGLPLVNGTQSLDIYFDELKASGDIVILRVKPAKLNINARWKLWQKGFREEEVVFDGVLLRDASQILFVRAPVNIEEAWKGVEVKLASYQSQSDLILKYGRLDINTKLKRFYWDFMFGLKSADGGLVARFNISNGDILLEGLP